MDSSGGRSPNLTAPARHVPEFQLLLSLLTGQLRNGCNHPACTHVLCHTGRQNINRPRPVRRYRVLSARVIALSICSSPNPETRICPHYARAFPNPLRAELGHILDHSSWAQLTAATTAVERATSLETPFDLRLDEKALALNDLHRRLDELEGSDPRKVTPGRIIHSNQKFLDAILASLDFVFASSPNQNPEAWKYVLQHCISDSSGYPLRYGPLHDRQYKKDVIDVLDTLNQEYLIDLLERAIKVYTQRCIFQDIYESEFGHHVPRVLSAGRDGSAVQDSSSSSDASSEMITNSERKGFSNRDFLLKKHISSSTPLPNSPPETNTLSSIFVMFETKLWELSAAHKYELHVWLKVLFLRKWEGNPVLTRFELCAQCLLHVRFLLEAIEFKREAPEYTHEPDAIPVPAIGKRVDDFKMVRSWLKLERRQREGNDLNFYHILDFEGLFRPFERLTYFRTANFLQMSGTTRTTQQLLRHRIEALPQLSSLDLPEDVRQREKYFFVLNISRDNVLKGAFDQLWHRRSSELRRPLRVRLNEIDDLDYGQDLGGVQAEFFNLVCREACVPDKQLFVLEPRTGVYWLAPGSLQPLYMFEMLGMLFALAWYNGITLPINLPNFFYHSLTREDLDIYTDISWIEDLAPEIASSLRNLPDESLEDLEWVYPVEANGLRLTTRLASSPEDSLRFQQPLEPTLHVYDITTIGKSPFVDGEGGQCMKHSVQNLGITAAWRGWTMCDSSTPPEPVTPQNKADYIKGYIAWLTVLSVLPQYRSFHQGIRRIFGPDHPAFQILKARSAKRLLEGSSRLDIEALQAAATYENCDAESQYIQEFWSIVAGWPEERQLKLLKFVTALERVPFGGESTLKFVIERGSIELDGKLPTCSTCFGTLYLPWYPSKEILAQKLELAVELGNEGFGVS